MRKGKAPRPDKRRSADGLPLSAGALRKAQLPEGVCGGWQIFVAVADQVKGTGKLGVGDGDFHKRAGGKLLLNEKAGKNGDAKLFFGGAQKRLRADAFPGGRNGDAFCKKKAVGNFPSGAARLPQQKIMPGNFFQRCAGGGRERVARGGDKAEPVGIKSLR